VGVELVDIVGGLTSIAALAIFLRFWQPAESWDFPDARQATLEEARVLERPALVRAWIPWVFLSVAVILWGLAPVKAFLNGGPSGLAAYRAGARPVVSQVLSPIWDVPLLHRVVFRDYPVMPSPVERSRLNDPAYRNQRGEAAQFTLNWLSATGTAILLAALASALYLRVPFVQLLTVALATGRRMRAPLATLSLAFTRTGALYPFFATFLGWLGVALTGSDTSSNVLFGSLQKITAQQ